MKVYAPLKLIPWCAFFAVATCFGQIPSAGSLQQNIDNTLHQSPLPNKDRADTIIEPKGQALVGISFRLRKIVYAGNTLLSNPQIELLLAPYLNKSIDFGQLQALANSIEEAYRTLGAIARVVIPEQIIIDDTLRVQIEESRWGSVRLLGISTRVGSQQISQAINASQISGQLVNLKTLERAVLLADDLPGIKVDAIYSQSPVALRTDVIATLADEPLYSGSLQADNSGPSSIGANRVVGNLGVNSPLGIGDLISVVYLRSDGSDYARLSYTLPIGDDGLRMGVNASTMSYKLVAVQFAGLGAAGSGSSEGFETLYPVIRSKTNNLYVGFNSDYHVFGNSNALSGSVSRYSVMDYSAALFLNTFDRFGGTGASNFSLIVTNGNTNLDGSPNQFSVASYNNAQGGFTKTRYIANRTHYLDHDGLSIYTGLSGQASGANLDPSEMFYLGGLNGVRAYPTNEGAGSQGQLLNLELRKTLTQNTNLALFYDYGHVQVNPNNAYAVKGDLNSYDQKGVGLSVGMQLLAGVDIKTTWAKRVGTDSNLSSTGTYQNGSTGSTQLWLTAIVGF